MYKSSHNRSWPRLVTLGLVLTVSGCALVAGIEKREDDGTNPFETVEVFAGGKRVFTTFLCVDYCDAVTANCSGNRSLYVSREACINTCNAMPAGEQVEPEGHTGYCHLKYAELARSEASEYCMAASPDGDGVCGTPCQAWCALLESECPTEYSQLGDCAKACSTLPDAHEYSVKNNYENDDSVQCRLIHVGAVGADKSASPHCGHARYAPDLKCIPTEAEPSCETYCKTVMTNCEDSKDGEFAQYDSKEDCLATCEALPPGLYSDRVENTMGCRLYHSRSANGTNAKAHCYHAGPTGDGHCGDRDTGNCESYCYLYQAACDDEYEAEGYEDNADCARQCTNDFAENGAALDFKYTASSATKDDTLQCRIANAVKILGGDDDISCKKVIPSGECD